MGTYSNFCCRSGGNNLNPGTLLGDTTEPGTSPLQSYAGGDWNATTNIYTAPVGADFTGVAVDQFMSVYVDGDTAPTTNQYLVGRITALNTGTRQITCPPLALKGSEVTTGTGTRSARIGGAMLGPQGSALWPFDNTALAGLVNAAGNPPQINLKNDQTYAITAAMTANGNGIGVRGYASAYGDGGRAVIDGGTTGAAYILLTLSGTSALAADLELKNNGNSGSATGLLQITGANTTVYRVTAHDCRSIGIFSNNNIKVVECEVYNWNQANVANVGAFQTNGGAPVYVRCIAHGSTGNGHGWHVAVSGFYTCVGCIAHETGATGVGFNSAHMLINCDAYKNGSHGWIPQSNRNLAVNCNFIDNGGYGVSNGSILVNHWNCGFGSGTMANTSGTVQTAGLADEVGSFSYPADQTPWADPDNGDFRITHASAKQAGRGVFLQTESGQAGTIGYPDVGAADAAAGGGGGGGSSGGGILQW